MMNKENRSADQIQLVKLVAKLKLVANLNRKQLFGLVKKYPKTNGDLFSKTDILAQVQLIKAKLHPQKYQEIKSILLMKPTRSLSGVAVVTVLTKPFPCPGQCIFCPSDLRMPKSYLSNEPGAQRAERNYFDPYLQVYNRLEALRSMGHNLDKIELIILGGSWSIYPEKYQLWFIKECFRALNEFQIHDRRKEIYQYYHQIYQQLKPDQLYAPTLDPNINQKAIFQQQEKINNKKQTFNQLVREIYLKPEKRLGLDKKQSANWQELLATQKNNESAKIRGVGLSIETRPDLINKKEVIRFRKQGCTKIQIGIQSLRNQILKKNKRGHQVKQIELAFSLLRQAGFKIHIHWMINLYGSTVKADQRDFLTVFNDQRFKPDEIKIYPCSLIKSAELMDYYHQGLWRPYSEEELLQVVAYCLKNTPEYCRITRVVRDIPSPDIVVGNKKTNFRQIAENYLRKKGEYLQDIRAREIKNERFDFSEIKFNQLKYETTVSTEYFLQYIIKSHDQPDTKTPTKNRIVAFLRLSLPKKDNFIKELNQSAVIREIHVYGQALALGQKNKAKTQHLGLGTQLINQAKKIVIQHHYQKIAVISAIGTKEYYRQRDFEDGKLYQFLTFTL